MVDLLPKAVKPTTPCEIQSRTCTHGGDHMSMGEQHTIFTRLGNWLRRNGRDGDLPLSNHDTTSLEPRSTFLRPWARRDAALQNLQDGFGTLTDLMARIGENLDRHSK